jgi:trigger factor
MPLATVKGFRKGQVPKDLVAKQYVVVLKKKVKKVDLALERFIQSERLNLLGTPPKVNENFDWDAEELTLSTKWIGS